jgi:hypothetical protein
MKNEFYKRRPRVRVDEFKSGTLCIHIKTNDGYSPLSLGQETTLQN